jgi:hypothetical protein
MLAVDATSSEWRAVVRYAESRIAELTATCVSTSSSDEQRRNAAQRIEELADLIAGPTLTRHRTEHTQVNPPVETY